MIIRESVYAYRVGIKFYLGESLRFLFVGQFGEP
jgi:hypothetical protein